MTRPRARRIALAAAAFVVVAAAGVVSWLVTSERGARLAFEQLGSVLPGKLTVGSMRGTIRGPLEVRDMRYETDRVHIAVDRMRLDWSLRALPRGRIDVRRLEADHARVVILAAAPDTLLPELPDLDLPMDIMVRRATIDHIEVLAAGSDSAFRIDRASLADAAFRDTLDIGSLSLVSPRGELELHGRAHTRGRYAVDLGGRWMVRAASGTELRGVGTWVGSLDTLRVDQRTTSPFSSRAVAILVHPLRRLRFDGRATFAGLEPRRLNPSWPAGRATGWVDIAGTLDRFASRGLVDASVPSTGPLRMTFTMERDTAGVTLREAVLTRPRGPGRVTAAGRLDVGHGTSRIDVTARWSGVAFPVARPRVHSARGTLRVWGPIDRYRISANLVAAGQTVPEGPWRLEGSGSRRGLEVSSVRGELLRGAVTGRASVSWQAPVTWSVALAGRELDPSAAWPTWPGRVGFDLAGRGTGGPDGVRGWLAIPSISGTLNGRPIAGRGVARFGPGSYAMDSLDVMWGPDHLVAAGVIAPRWDFRWTLNAPDLSYVIPRGAGSLVSQGRLTGSPDAPGGEFTVAGDSLRWEDRGADSLSVVAELDPARASRVRLDATGFHTRRNVVDHVAFTAEGSRASHVMRLGLTSAEDSLRLEAQGAWVARAWNGRLTRLDLVSYALGTWSLDRPATLAASPAGGSLAGLCAISTNGRCCADAGWRRDGTWDLRSKLEAVKLSLLESRLPAGVTLAGTMSGAIEARGVRERWTGDARFDVGPGQISYPIDSKRRGSTPIDPSRLTLRSDAGGLMVTADVSLGPAGTMRGDVRLPDYGQSGMPAPRGRIDGHLHAQITDLAFVQGFVSDLSGTQGALVADLTLAGTVRDPRWTGRARLTGGAADVQRLAIQLREGTLTAESDASGLLAVQGSIRSGAGRLAVDGHASLGLGGVPELRGTISGERFQAINTPEASMLVSPRLDLVMVGDSVNVTGEIVVPQARLNPKRRGDPAVRPSPDIVYVRGDSSLMVERAPRRLSAEVRVVLGDDVRIRAQGLDAKVTGSVLAIERPGRPTTGSGELSVVQGTYLAYGRSLSIERGRLVFGGGPIANPGLDVRATRRAPDGVTAGFEVQGTLEAPQFTVFSDPPMAQRDALAYIVLGRSLDRSNESQQAMVSDAAANLGLSGGSYLASQFAHQIGVEEASLESHGGFHDASLMLGKYLSPRIYVNYGIGVLDQASTLRVQYFVNRMWTLEAEAGTENRAEIFYTVER